MSKKLLFSLLGVAVIGAGAYGIYSFFKGGDRHTRFIPKNAGLVVSFNVKSLAEKSDFNGKLKETKFYKDMMADLKKEDDSTAVLFSELLKDPMSSGLDVFGNAYLFVCNDSNSSYMGICAGIKDESKFEATLAKISGLKEKIKDASDYKHLKARRGTRLAWNKNGMLLLSNMGYYSREEDNSEDVIGELITQDKDASIASNKYFSKMEGRKQDIGFLMNYSELIPKKEFRRDKEMEKLTETFEGVYYVGGLNFENNRIVMSTEACADDEKKLERLNFMKKEGIDPNTLAFVTADKIFASMSVNIDIPKVLAFADDMMDIDRQVERMASNFGLTESELKSVFNGQLTFALTDISVKTDSVTMPTYNPVTGDYEFQSRVITTPQPVMTLNVGIKNKENFRKLLAGMPFRLNANGYMSAPIGSSQFVHLVETPHGATLTTDSVLIMAIVKDKKLGGNTSHEALALAKNNPGSMYIDLNLDNYPAGISELLNRQMGEYTFGMVQTYLGIFKNIKSSSKGNEGTIEINLKEGEGNALFRLIKQGDTIYEKQQQMKAKQQEEMEKLLQDMPADQKAMMDMTTPEQYGEMAPPVIEDAR